MKTVTKTLSVMALAGASLMVIAAAPTADLNGDNQVSLNEFTAAAMTRFDAYDADSNGFLTQDEREAMREARHKDRAARKFQRLDGNGDGFVSEAEMSAAQAERQSRRGDRRDEWKAKFDTNGDGTISETERETAKSKWKDARSERRDARKGKRGERGKTRPKVDTDGDGQVSRTEYMTSTNAMFAHMDANQDGVLTEGEGHKKRGKKKRWRRGR